MILCFNKTPLVIIHIILGASLYFPMKAESNNFFCRFNEEFSSLTNLKSVPLQVLLLLEVIKLDNFTESVLNFFERL